MSQPFDDLIEARFGVPLDTEAPDRGTETLASMLARRVHRRFADRAVPEGLVNLVLAAALSMPAKSDLQQVALIRVRDAGRRRAIEALIPDMPWMAEAPVFFVVCGDGRRIRRICELQGVPFGNDHLDAVLNAASDAAMVLAGLVTAAEASGLGCCPISHVRNHIDEVAGILNLPDHVFPLAGLCVGWPLREGWVSLRLPPAVTVHDDVYDDSRLADELAAYDRRRDARFAIPPDKQRDVAAYGRKDFYGWSADKARQVSHTEREPLARFLRGRGFSLE